jgi:acyl-CoA reductase-like NAD-dependent aldehyde dehydrogenase
MGPLGHRGHFQRVQEQLAGLGGERRPTAAAPDGPGFFMSPTVVTGADAREELFAPVLTVRAVRDDAEALAAANELGDGLAAYVFAGDPERAFALGRALHAGEVRLGGTHLLDLAPGSAQSFWGTSGIGGHGAREVLLAHTGTRVVGEDDPALPM